MINEKNIKDELIESLDPVDVQEELDKIYENYPEFMNMLISFFRKFDKGVPLTVRESTADQSSKIVSTTVPLPKHYANGKEHTHSISMSIGGGQANDDGSTSGQIFISMGKTTIGIEDEEPEKPKIIHIDQQ